MKYRIATLFVLASTLAITAYAADVQPPKLNEVGSVKIAAEPGDLIFAARSHRHEYVYVAHARDKSVDVIDVSHPSSPRQLNGNDARRASRNAVIAMTNSPDAPGTARVLNVSDPNEPLVIAEFPNAISTTSDNRQLIYVLDQNSLRILTAPPAAAEDDSWYKNAMTPG
jgi:hypothetical protein